MRFTYFVIPWVVGLIVAGCGKPESGAPPLPSANSLSARVETASYTSAASVREAVGTVRSATTAAIQSKTVGHVTAVHANAGDTVAADTVLAEIDPREAEAQQKSAQSGLAVAEQGFAEVLQAIAAAKSARDAAEAQRQLAQSTFERQKSLFDQKAVSKQVFDEAEAAAKSATASANARAQDLAALEAKREQAQASIEQAKAGLDSASVGMSYMRVTAPFGGLITAKAVEVGDLASPGMTLFQIEDSENYRLEANVDETAAAGVRVGDKVPVTVDAVGDKVLEGIVTEIVPASDPSSRTFVVKISLPKQDGVRSGQFGRARFSGIAANTLTIPRTALVVRGQLEGVFTLDQDSVARLRLIKTGKAAGDRIQVLSGLNPGDRYLIEITPAVTDGTRVTAL